MKTTKFLVTLVGGRSFIFTANSRPLSHGTDDPPGKSILYKGTFIDWDPFDNRFHSDGYICINPALPFESPYYSHITLHRGENKNMYWKVERFTRLHR